MEVPGQPDAQDIAQTPDAEQLDNTPDAHTSQSTPDASNQQAMLPIDASVVVSGNAEGLWLSEIALQPTGGEFIEIVNPTGSAIALDNYYVTDSGDQYFKLPGGVPTVDSGDFIAHFPSGSSIASGGIITMALGTSASFQTAYSVAPTYSLTDGTMMNVIAMTGTPSLTNGGEFVGIFYWDGNASLVTDVDMMLAGVPSTANGITDKSGVSVNGATYATDSNSMTAQPTAPGSGVSTKRIASPSGHETESGDSNGIGGSDQTSEDTSTTWDTTFTAATPGATTLALP